jgi:hypothetical protein
MGDKIAAAQQPELFPHLLDYWIAFQELDRGRSYTRAGPNPIPFTDIAAYGGARGFVGDDLLDLHRYVSVLDTCYLTHVTKRIQKQREEAAKRGQKHSHRR